MIRNLKVLGLALVAVFAMSAMMASAASAQTLGELTSDGPVTLTGTDIEGVAGDLNALTYPGQDAVQCPKSHYHGHKVGGAKTDLIPVPATTITVEPEYTNCVTVPGGLPVTIDMNKCDYVFHTGETTGEGVGTYGVTADLDCSTAPVGSKHVLVTVFSSASHALRLCTITFGPEKNQGLSGAHLTNNNGHVDVTGTFNGITAVRSGLCGSAETKEAQYHVAVTMQGKDSKGNATSIEITH
ncbi:MAG TPA: hypothetical protein VFM94_11625 [Solirubrobacterales bacterium]|nr:hypothetical protein [Solirubrobacterales bacterium]